MVSEVKTYICHCDSCNQIFEDDNCVSMYLEKEEIEEELMNHQWIKHDNKYYCPNCYITKSVGDENAEISIRTEFEKHSCPNCQAENKFPPSEIILRGEIVGYCHECGHVIWK